MIWNILLMFLKKYWQYILIILLILIVYFGYNAWQEDKARADRNEKNFKELKEHPDKRIETLTIEQLEEFNFSLLDSMRKYIDRSIKAKNVTNITHIHEYYIDSSKIIYQAPMLGEHLFDISYSDKCWGFEGNINLQDTSVALTRKWFENDMDIVVYWQRPRWFNSKFKLMPRWFRQKETFIESFDKCNAERKIVRTNVIKKD